MKYTFKQKLSALRQLKTKPLSEVSNKTGISYSNLEYWCKKVGITPIKIKRTQWQLLAKLLK